MEFSVLKDDFNSSAQPALSLDRALELFDELADMEDIAFGYPQDGCYARAHIMCQRMLDAGLTPRKAWAFEDENYLVVKSHDGKDVTWWYHVAPALSIRTPEGTVQDFVFDPSLFDGPVSLEEWGAIMSVTAPEKQLQVVDLGTAPVGYDSDYRPSCRMSGAEIDSDASGIMERYVGRQKAGQRVVFSSPARQQVSHTQAPPFTMQGRTWISEVEIARQPAPPPPKKTSFLSRLVKSS